MFIAKRIMNECKLSETKTVYFLNNCQIESVTHDSHIHNTLHNWTDEFFFSPCKEIASLQIFFRIARQYYQNAEMALAMVFSSICDRLSIKVNRTSSNDSMVLLTTEVF